jgi:hypothetical protein
MKFSPSAVLSNGLFIGRAKEPEDSVKGFLVAFAGCATGGAVGELGAMEKA